MVPKHITTPIGIHSASPLIIIGRTPSAVVQDVRKIGLILLFPASMEASFTSHPFSNRRYSAYSNISIPFLTIIPIRLTSPRTEVSPKSSLNSHSPRNPPKKHSVLSIMVSTAMETFLKCTRRKKNRMATAHRNVAVISGATSPFMEDSPPYVIATPSGSPGLISFSTNRFTFFMTTGWL